MVVYPDRYLGHRAACDQKPRPRKRSGHMDWCLKFQKASHLVVDTTTKSQKRRPQFGSQHRLSSVYIWSISPLQEGILLWPRHTQFAAFMVCQRRQGWKGKTSIAFRSFRRQHLNTKRGNGVHNGHGKIFREVDTPLSGGIPAGFVSFVFGLRFFLTSSCTWCPHNIGVCWDFALGRMHLTSLVREAWLSRIFKTGGTGKKCIWESLD